MEHCLAVSVEAGAIVRMRRRLGLALLAAASTGSLYAEGVLKNGWIEVLVLLPVGLFLLLPARAARLENLLVALTAVCLAVSGLDLCFAR